MREPFDTADSPRGEWETTVRFPTATPKGRYAPDSREPIAAQAKCQRPRLSRLSAVFFRDWNWAVRSLQAALLIWLVIALVLQSNIGLADNGDYNLTMGSFTSGPLGIEPNWPPATTPAWSERFFYFWLPYWKLKWSLARPVSSVGLLWLPGVSLNYALYSRTVLDVRALSLFPKALLVLILLLLFSWIDRQASRYRLPLHIAIAIPLTLIVTTTDYLAYFNTFYRETGSLIFLLLLFASLLALAQRRRSWPRVLGCLGLLLLLAATKPSNFYWPLVGVPAVVYASDPGPTLRVHVRHYLLWGLGATALLMTVAAYITSPSGCTQCNRYHSLFMGTLYFSDHPTAHLAALHMSEAADCIGVSAFVPPGTMCFAKYRDRLSFADSLRIMVQEPLVPLRMFSYAADNMQDISLEYLGHYVSGDPIIQTKAIQLAGSASTRFWAPYSATPFNLWSTLKYHYFPIGTWLLVVLAGFAAVAVWGLAREAVYRDLSLLGLLATIGCAADMLIAIAGEGTNDLTKHLTFANVLFDVAAVATVSLIVAACVDLYVLKVRHAPATGGSISRNQGSDMLAQPLSPPSRVPMGPKPG